MIPVMIPARAVLRSPRAEDNGFSPRTGFRPFHPAEAESTLGARFRETALRCGSKIAVADGTARISYAELLERAGAIASDLRLRHGEGGGIVAICLPAGLGAIEIMLGALLAEFGYFCLDPSLPEQQKARQLRAARPVAAVGGESVPQWRDAGAGVFDTQGPAGIAALYATSGSMGEPKLVAWPHRGILFDIGRQTNDLYLGPDDRFDSLFSFAFSASLATVFGALLNGAELHCHDFRDDLAALPHWFAERRITVSTMTVSMLRHLCLLRPPANSFASLRLLSVGGEALRPADVDAFRSVFPPTCVLQNAMASTEVRTYAQYFVPASGRVENPVPIGWPVAGKQIRILDENGQPVAMGSPGEITVESRYLACGYCDGGQFDCGGAAAKFEALPDGATRYRTGDCGMFRPDGSLVFLGRVDAQAKIRGHRVELEHIAHTIEMHLGIRAAAVVGDEDGAGNNRLVAYVVAREGATADETRLRNFLREQLPEYSIPAAFVFVSELPLNANFKLDRRRLPPPPSHVEPAGAAPKIEILREIWKTVLRRSDIPDDQSFWDVGGDSLAALRILVAILDRFHCDLPPGALHRFPTLRLLAARVSQAVEAGSDSATLIPFQSGGKGCPVFFVAGMGGSAHGYERLAARMASAHPTYGLNTTSGFTEAPAGSVESMAARLVAEIEGVVEPGGKAVLVGYSFGGTIAFQTARQLQARGNVAPLPILIDMPAVNAPGRPKRGLGRQSLDVLRNLPAWAAYEATHFDRRKFLLRVRGHLTRLSRALGILTPAQDFDPRIYLGSGKVPEAYQAVLTGMYRAMLAYVPGAYAGRMILLWARVPTLFQETDPKMGWQFVAGAGLEVYPIAGRHGDCMDEQRLPELAALLLHCIANSGA